MTYDECMKSNSKKAQRVREILKEIKSVKFPDDLIMYKILREQNEKRNHTK